MKKIIFSATAFFFMLVSLALAKDNTINVKWLGHACFQLTMPDGKVIVIDPYSEKVGYDIIKLKADLILVTHEHHDHNNIDAVQGDPKVLRGLTEGGQDYNKVSYKKDGLDIYSVNSHHDNEQGAKRGKNVIFKISYQGFNIVHVGDLGQILTDEQVKEIGNVHLLLVPVGGYYTIDADDADKVIAQLDPTVVIPMHFKTEKSEKLPISTKDDFLNGKDYEDTGKNEYDFSYTSEPLKVKNNYNVDFDYDGKKYIVLDYK